MNINILLFGPLRERVGEPTLALEVAPGTTTAGLVEQLSVTYEPMRRYRNHLRIAVNGTYSASETTLQPDDEVALITPTSGG